MKKIIRQVMNLRFQIEEQKRKSHVLGDFVIDTTYIRELASQVLNADDKVKSNPDLQQVCEILSTLCDEVSVSVMDLKDMIPASAFSPDPDNLPPVE